MKKKKSFDQSNVIHKHKMALLIIDMLNTFDFPEGKSLARLSRPIADQIFNLKIRFKKHRIPVIYVNDNFGQWQSSWPKVYEHCAQKNLLGAKIAEVLKPEEDDYFVLKPKHSAFFSTNDAHMREYQIIIPEDCVASNTVRDNKIFLEQVEKVLGVKTVNSKSIRIS